MHIYINLDTHNNTQAQIHTHRHARTHAYTYELENSMLSNFLHLPEINMLVLNILLNKLTKS